ncbi:MAG: IclR family transcriptional regulator [Burkholderiaceae bacterium]
MNTDKRVSAPEEKAVSSLHRAIEIVKALASHAETGLRVSELCQQLGQTQATTHRLLQQLIEEGLVEQGAQSKRYRLAIDFFALAARAGDGGGLRELCRPALLRLGASLGDSVFLLVRSSFDAVCLDRCEGPFPIRTFTGDIGGRVPLGVGQGALTILAYLPSAEQEEVMRFNVPRIRHMGSLDEVFLRTEAAKIRAQGYASFNSGLLEGMAGAAVPVFDRNGRVVAALSVGTLTNRLNADRLPVVIELLQREAKALALQINPFDPALRRPSDSLGAMRPARAAALS